MPFVRGAELYKVYCGQKRFPEQVVKFYAVQLIMAIGYLHELGIVHRDLKLENILINSHAEVKLTDFGVSKVLTADEQSCETFVGTARHMAPERFGEHSQFENYEPRFSDEMRMARYDK